MTHEEQIARAEEAQRVLNSPLFDAAFKDTRQALMEAWASLDIEDKEKGRELHRMLRSLEKVRVCLETHITTGKLAQKEIDGKRKLFAFGR